jgi:glycosyltransferase involved in cell wall biosynthesis
MKVTLDARALDVGFLREQGIGRLAHELVAELVPLAAERGGELVVLREGAGSPYGASPDGARTVRLRRPPLPSRIAELPEQVLLPRDLRRLRPDVHHALSPFRSARDPGVPTVMTFHDAIPLMFPKHYMRTGLSYRLRYAAVRRARRVLAVSERAAHDAVAHLAVDRERIDVVPHAADARFGPVDPAPALARLGIDRPYVLYVGGLSNDDPRKRVADLIDSFAAWARTGGRRETLVLCGATGRAAEPLRERARRSGADIRFTGFVADEDMPGLYSGASCLVTATRYEGFGLPALEALACGTPVAAYDVGALREVAGPGALLVSDGDGRELMMAVEALSDGPELRARLADAGRIHAAGFSWRRSAEATWAAYERALRPPRSS